MTLDKPDAVDNPSEPDTVESSTDTSQSSKNGGSDPTAAGELPVVESRLNGKFGFNPQPADEMAATHGGIIAENWERVTELEDRVEELEQQNEELERRNEELEDKLEGLIAGLENAGVISYDKSP